MSPIEVVTNFYEITSLPTRPYHHLHNISPESVIKARNYEILDRLQRENAHLLPQRPVYDGRANLFCRQNVQSGSYTVYMGRNNTNETRITITRVNVVNPEDVKKLMRPRNSNEPTDPNTISLSLLQLIIRQAPNLRFGFPPHAKSFFVAAAAKDLRCGLSAWRGYFQSVRPTMDRILVNIDVSHAAVYTPGPLYSTMMAVLRCRNLRDLQDISDSQFSELRQFLKGVRISVTVSPQMRPRPITDLVRQAGLQEFEKENGERTTVQIHFEGKYNKRLAHPQNLGVKLGRTAVIPGEYCEIMPSQLYRKKLSPNVQKEFLGFATQKPNTRLESIVNAIKMGTFNHADSDFMKDAGMSISSNPISVQGNVIEPPQICYRNKNWSEDGCMERFVYDRVSPNDVQHFVTTLNGNLRNLGMTISDEPYITFANPTTPYVALEDAGTKLYNRFQMDAQLILVFLPEFATECRIAVKHWGDTVRGIPTQCVRGGKWNANLRNSNRLDQYCNNVALKINARLGGVNSVLPTANNKIFEHSMIIGADVGHPGPGVSHRPSITGLVATVDQQASVVTSSVEIQRPRQEIIEHLDRMVDVALLDWYDFRKRRRIMPPRATEPLPPTNLIFYRDGVSEGEFAQVAEQEIPKIKAAFMKRGLPVHFHPKVLFIVVVKRHHVRFFPKRPNDADRSGNCPAGLLVDKAIKNPNYDDFYLQSHAGLLATSRPAHYTIIKNETTLSTQQIQRLTFDLCHLYANATRSVSIPAPVYYADKICQRLPFHCPDGESLSDTASMTAGEAEFDEQLWRHKFKPAKLHRRYYYL